MAYNKVDMNSATNALENLLMCKHSLYVLRDSPAAVQKEILKHADETLILAISELALNILNGNLKIDPQCLSELRKYKTSLRALAYPSAVSNIAHGKESENRKGARSRVAVQSGRGSSKVKGRDKNKKAKKPSSEWKKKRRYLVQKGGGVFLTSLISSALGGLVGKVVSNLVEEPRQQVRRDDD